MLVIISKLQNKRILERRLPCKMCSNEKDAVRIYLATERSRLETSAQSWLKFGRVS